MLEYAAAQTAELFDAAHECDRLVDWVERLLHNRNAVHVAQFRLRENGPIIKTFIKVWRAENRDRERNKSRQSDFRRAGNELQFPLHLGNRARADIQHQAVTKD